MSVYIKGMEMPKAGAYFCELGVLDESTAVLTIFDTFDEPRRSYKLFPVPEHGRLGDLDALINKIGENVDKAKGRSYDWWYACTVAYDFALAAPTIIPADPVKEGEG